MGLYDFDFQANCLRRVRHDYDMVKSLVRLMEATKVNIKCDK